MPTPAALPWLLALGAVATVGGIYYVTREDEEDDDVLDSEGEEEEEEETPPDDEPPPPPTPPTGPGGIKDEGTGLPPEPAGGWNSILTPMSASEALQEVQAEGIAATGLQGVERALRLVFPVPEWAPPLSQWQQDARDFMWDQLRGLSSWEVLVGQGAPFEAPYAFWLRRRAEVAACRNIHQTTSDIAQCAASNIFPEMTWPPPADAPAWQTTVWQQLLQQVAAG